MGRPLALFFGYSINDPDFPENFLKILDDGSITVRAAPFSYTPLGYQQIPSADLGSAVGLDVPDGATMALIAVSGASVRWRDDGTAPTSSLGMPVANGQEFQYSADLSAIQFIGAGATLDVSYYA
jgi:hypothetical protein